jgi:hypothetical protein
MATNDHRVSDSARGVRSSVGEMRPFTNSPLRLSSIECEILAQLAARGTDGRRYAPLQVADYSVVELDEAIEALHDAGLLNAFFVNQAARPKFHPSSLTREGRRIYEQYLRSSRG